MGSDNSEFNFVDYVVLVIMLMGSTIVGIYFGFFAKSKNTTDEYLMGGRKMKTLPIAISLMASQLSAVTITAVSAETYSYGYNYFYNGLAALFSAPILAFAITPIFYENHFDNCYEYLEKRFNKATRQFVTITFLFTCFPMWPIYMFVPSLAFSQVSGFNVHVINIVVSSICVFYTMLGGIKAVVWADVIQGGIMLGTLIIVAVMGTLKTGGLDKVIDYASEGGRLDTFLSIGLRERVTLWNAFLGGAILWVEHVGLNQNCVQRIVALPKLRDSQKSLILASFGIFLILALCCFIGIVMYAYYHGCDPILAGLVEKPDKMLSFFVQDVFGHLRGLPGIFISCLFSASLSTLSASFNSSAGIIYFDYIKPFIKHTDAKANIIMKIMIIVMGVYCVLAGLIVQQFDSLVQTIMTLAGIYTGSVVGLYLMGIFMPRIHGKVAFTSFALTFLTMAWWIFNSQVRLQNGSFKYVTLPGRIDDCGAYNIEVVNKSATEFKIEQGKNFTHSFQSEDYSLYDTSFMWYKCAGVIAIWIIALPLSFIWRGKSNEEQNPKLFSPCLRKQNRQPRIELDELEPLKITQINKINPIIIKAKDVAGLRKENK